MTLGLASTEAAAQWYLFPGFKKDKQDSTALKPEAKTGSGVPVVKIIPAAADTIVPIAADTIVPVAADSAYALFPLPGEGVDSLAVQAADSVETFVLDIPETINFSLVLPFESRHRTNANMMDFYAGALLAARDLGKEGLQIDFGCYDSSDGKIGITDWSRENSDVLVGPISYQDLLKSIDEHGCTKTLISPLDPQAAALAQDFPVIHAATPFERQIDDLVDWVREEMDIADELVVVEEKDIERSSNSEYLFARLDSLGMQYSIISYGILEGLSISSVFEEHTSRYGTTRYLIASDRESFAGDAVRNIGLVHRNHQAVLYGNSRLRSYPSIEADDFHSLGLRFTAAYFVDYTDIDVKNFILSYRALFQSEPGSFAFSGYDTAHYFLGICSKAGRNWPMKICEYGEQGLQTDFSFAKTDGMKGAVNNAVRRAVYNPDYTITIIR